MKGSKLPKLAALLLVLTLVTTCFVSGTFAKYVSEGEGEDAAHSAALSQKAALQMPFSVTTLLVKRGFRKARRLF